MSYEEISPWDKEQMPVSDGFEVLEADASPFFAPVASDLIDTLIGQYDNARRRITEVSSYMAGPDVAAVIHYFLEGNADDERGRGRITLKRTSEHLFDPVGAIAALNASYWSKALQMTDVLDVMPQKRRDEWNKQMQNPHGVKAHRRNSWDSSPTPEWEVEPLPDFTEETVRATLTGLLNMRAQFLAERVDGIFRGLSGEHVTNAPEAFGKRMIIGYVLNDYWSTNHGRAGLINDLRCVIAKFMGRDEPKWNATSGLIDTLKSKWGQWVTVDGGAIKIRLYKKGTAHMEIHPDMAWRLNMVLAHMYPLAIPAEFRQRPPKRPKDVPLMQRPLPFAVLEVLGNLKRSRHASGKWEMGYSHAGENKAAKEEAIRIIEGIGGAQTSPGAFEFEYDPTEVFSEIITSGCIPDQRAHQYYPTPENLAQRAVDLADIGPDDICVEPSAGTGGLAKFMPKDRTRCVEISKMHATILAALGFNVVCEDFLTWAREHQLPGQGYDRVVMNPPFDQGRWQAHLEHAADLLKPGGRLVAILPSGARTRGLLPGWALQWVGPIHDAFAGTSVSVTILVADRPGA